MVMSELLTSDLGFILPLMKADMCGTYLNPFFPLSPSICFVVSSGEDDVLLRQGWTRSCGQPLG